MAALMGALVALAVVGGFLALDRTTLHWYAEKPVPTAVPTRIPPPTPSGPTHTASEIMQAVYVQRPRWCNTVADEDRQYFIETNRGPIWDQPRRTWILLCSFTALAVDDSGFTISNCLEVDDVTLELRRGRGSNTLRGDQGITLEDC